ncbi:MAG: Chromosomal replication initiator protein DnaA [Microgenomates group bacterium GW2011_GWA2_37_6]|nr:MAG: Chromosomal replication initiator protein DnaA [Microgenomates group bacterium GW2011_GWA2_37_6]
MISTAEDLWKKVLAEIQTEVSGANFLTLFKGTSLISLEEGVATISAPSTMVIDLLNKRFYQLIKQSLDKNTGASAKIIFVPKAPAAHSANGTSGPLFSQSDKPKTIGHLPRVRPDYTFQNFAVSGSNQLAYVSASAVTKKLGTAYSPLFIYGPVGVGKTHLMQAVANEVYEKTPDKKILYITSEEFTNEVVEAIRGNETAKMKRKFRNLDLLMIDDIQFIAGKERVQEELFHTFNILVDNSSQIILTSDRPPSEIKKAEKRLLSRFAGGLTVDIESPDFELRCAILLTKSKKFNFDLDIETAKVIAEKTEDTRELEGLLLRVITEASSRQEDPSPDLAKRALNGKAAVQKNLYPEEIVRSICNFYNIKPTQLRGAKRDARLVRARQACMFVLKKDGGLTFSEIGYLLGGRDHTTIMHGVKKIEGFLIEKKFTEESLGIKDLRSSLVDN